MSEPTLRAQAPSPEALQENRHPDDVFTQQPVVRVRQGDKEHATALEPELTRGSLKQEGCHLRNSKGSNIG